MRVLILHTLPPEDPGPGRWREEFDLETSAQGIAQVLPDAAVAGIRGEPGEMLDAIRARSPDVVVNLCEAPLGQPRLEPHAAALLEWLGIPFTGSGSEALALCRRKDLTRAVLASAGVPVARLGVFPCVVKPAGEDGSAYIHSDSVCANEAEALRAAARLPGPALAEEFLPGREFAVSLWGRSEPEYVSIGETLFHGDVRLNTYEGKWDTECGDYRDTPLVYDLDIGEELRRQVVSAARQSWRLTGIRGYARIDVRLNAVGTPCVLDVNPNPALNPGAGVHRAAEEVGWSWEQFVLRQLEWAF